MIIDKKNIQFILIRHTKRDKLKKKKKVIKFENCGRCNRMIGAHS